MDHVVLDDTLTMLWLRADGGLQLVGEIVRLGWAPCVTVIVRAGTPGAVTVIVPCLKGPVLVVAFILNEPLPVRLVGVMLFTVSHDVLLLVTVQVLLDVTFTVEEFDAEAIDHVLVDRLSTGGGAACATDMVRVGAPGAVAVITPLLTSCPELADTFILNEPLPVRLAGVVLLMVSHDWLLLTVQVALDVTVTGALPPDISTPQSVTDNESVGGGGCVTVIVRVIPPVEMVTVAVLGRVLVLAVVARSVNVLLPVRFIDDTLSKVSQVALLLALHDLLDVTPIEILPAACDVRCQLACDTVSTAAGATCVTFIVRVIPGTVTVIAPVLWAVPLLADALMVNRPLPVRLAGDMLETVSQVVALLVTVHVALDVTVTLVLPPADC